MNRVRFTTGPCGLGTVLLAATGTGVCGLVLGDDVTELEAWLRAEFPEEIVGRADAELAGWRAAVVAQIDGPASAPAVPVDAHGTAFQQRVWGELRRIPRGETRTYTQVAAALGQPTAVRAVARACATNPVSVLTPCHRVVGSDGKLRGYRWGLARKERLLALERAGRREPSPTAPA
ncbi:MAG: methylated-DNA--[protein]-cysteine S-methyltransferase [Fimbriiglobus sp.]